MDFDPNKAEVHTYIKSFSETRIFEKNPETGKLEMKHRTEPIDEKVNKWAETSGAHILRVEQDIKQMTTDELRYTVVISYVVIYELWMDHLTRNATIEYWSKRYKEYLETAGRKALTPKQEGSSPTEEPSGLLTVDIDS
jgi:hypothetical protein